MRPPDRASWYIASITGHRKIGPRSLARLRSAMRDLVKNPRVHAVYFGGASGADTEALKAALEHREGKRPWLVVVLPNKVHHQPSATRVWTSKADEVIELGNPISKVDGYRSYKIRDRYLVDVASFMVAFFNGDYASGTGYTVKYAENKGTTVYRVPVSSE